MIRLNKKAEGRKQKAERTPKVQWAAACLMGATALSLVAGCSLRQSARRDELVSPPVNLQQAELAMGEHVFMANCTQCHPGGAGGLGPPLNNKRLIPDRVFKFQIRHGLGAMPKFSERRISDQQLDALLVYIDALQYQNSTAVH